MPRKRNRNATPATPANSGSGSEPTQHFVTVPAEALLARIRKGQKATRQRSDELAAGMYDDASGPLPPKGE